MIVVSYLTAIAISARRRPVVVARAAAARAAARPARCGRRSPTRTDGPALNGALADTGRLLGLFSLLLSAGILLS